MLAVSTGIFHYFLKERDQSVSERKMDDGEVNMLQWNVLWGLPLLHHCNAVWVARHFHGTTLDHGCSPVGGRQRGVLQSERQVSCSGHTEWLSSVGNVRTCMWMQCAFNLQFWFRSAKHLIYVVFASNFSNHIGESKQTFNSIWTSFKSNGAPFR